MSEKNLSQVIPTEKLSPAETSRYSPRYLYTCVHTCIYLCGYMVNYLVVQTGGNFPCADGLRRVYSDALAMHVTLEEPLVGKKWCLDLSLCEDSSHLCWPYCPSLKKELGFFNYFDSKLVTGGIEFPCFEVLLQKS